MATSLPLVAALACLSACNNATDRTQPASFRRPSDLAFVCFQTVNGRPTTSLHLKACQLDDDRDRPADRALYALVTQETRGEVAAVDITSNNPRIVDTDRRVPGFSFLPSGEVPIAIAVSGDEDTPLGDDPAVGRPTCAFVVTRGSLTLEGYPVDRFLGTQLADAGSPGLDTGGLDPDGGADAAARVVRLPHEPGDVVFVSGGGEGPDRVFVTYPTAGLMESRPVVTSAASGEDLCTIGAAEASWSLGALPLPEGAIDPEPSFDFARVCPGPNDEANYTPNADPTVESADPLRDALAPVPTEISYREVDETMLSAPEPRRIVRDGSYVWVSDASLPLLYRIDSRDGTVDTLRTDGPIHDFALTPEVGGERFIYAIDGSDRSVMVMRYDAATPRLILLPIASDLGGEPTRIPFQALAESIDIVDSRGRLETQTCIVDENPPPAASVLRGVFAAIGFLDGTIKFVDIEDRDRDCRAETDAMLGGACESTSRDRAVFIRQHSPRVLVGTQDPLTLAQAPEVAVDRATFRYEEDGVASEGTPRFGCVGEPDEQGECVARCPSGLGRLFPDAGEPLICGLTDPWAATADTWAAVWEGSLPNTRTNAGRLTRPSDGGTWRLDTPIDLCANGVLPMDQIAVIGALPEETAADPDCQRLVGTASGGVARPVLFPVVRFDRIDEAPYRWSLVIEGEEERLSEVERCYRGELLTLDMRASGQFVVTSSRDGFLHDVVEQDGTCVVRDATMPSGRVDNGELFQSPRLQFRLTWPDGNRVRAAVGFRVGTVPSVLTIPISSTSLRPTPALPVEIRWLEMDQHLYVLDQFDRGMLQYGVEPLRGNWVLER